MLVYDPCRQSKFPVAQRIASKPVKFRMCDVPDCNNQAIQPSGNGFVCGNHSQEVF